jgi:hypothetical protein
MMSVRVVIVALAAAGFFGSAAFAADPVRPEPRQATQAPAHRTEIVLASADQVNSSPAEQQAQSAPRHARVARVTTCRCGGQESQPDE